MRFAVAIPSVAAPRLVAITTIAFLALAAWNTYRIIRLATHAPDESTATVKALPRLPPIRSANTMIARITRALLFGQAQSATAIPETHQPFKLLGTYSLGNGRGYAIIASSGKPPRIYAFGSSLSANEKLIRIDAERVLIDTPRGEEGLKFSKPSSDGISLDSANLAGTANPRVRPVGPVSVSPPHTHSLSQNTRSIRVAPVEQKGHFAGVRPAPGSNPALFKSLGLRAGDIVTAIDGRALKSAQQARAALRSLSQGMPIRLTVERGSRVIILKRKLDLASERTLHR